MRGGQKRIATTRSLNLRVEGSIPPGSPLSANDVRAIDRLVEALRLVWNARGAADVVEKAERLMIGHSPRSRLTVFLLFMLTASRVWAQGPPYQTDDPTPVDYHHYEFYVFGTVSSTPLETDPVGPAFEFNWGLFPTCRFMQSCRSEPFARRMVRVKQNSMPMG